MQMEELDIFMEDSLLFLNMINFYPISIWWNLQVNLTDQIDLVTFEITQLQENVSNIPIVSGAVNSFGNFLLFGGKLGVEVSISMEVFIFSDNQWFVVLWTI